MDDLLADFIAETREMLEASAGEIVAWEADPADHTRLAAIFRFVHTVKGNCGFFDFPRLEKLSHAAEDALSDVRAGRRLPDSDLVTATLAVMDRIGEMVDTIEAGEELPEGSDDDIIAALTQHCEPDVSAIAETAPPAPNTAPLPKGTADSPQTGGSSAPAAPSGNTLSGAQRSIRLPVDLLDRVMSGVSDMVLARNDLAHRLRVAGNQPTIDGPFERLTSILTDVRDAITKMRMQSVDHLYSAFPRLVRDLSAELGKQVLIDLEGGDVELDREMIEMIRDPLTHIVRNAVDHGIELPTARLKAGKREIGLLNITARQSGNKITIVITDDGAGLDADRIAAKAVEKGMVTQNQIDAMTRDDILQLVFEPGLSTAETVSAISGRGVGLDVVRDNLEKVGGSISVTSTPGVGSLFYLQIPLTLSIIAGLTVEIAGQRFAIPQSYIEEIIDLCSGTHEFTTIGDRPLVTFRGERTPCLCLADALGLSPEMPADQQTLVVLRLASGDIVAVMVDRIHSHGDLVIKPLPPSIMETSLYGGSTLLENGEPALLLDMPLIALAAGLISKTRAQTAHPIDFKAQENKTQAQHAMVFTAYDGAIKAIRLEMVHRIETIFADAVQTGGGPTRAIIDREILPLIGLPKGDLPDGKIRVLRLSDGTCELLYAAARINDSATLDHALVPVEDEPFTEAMTLVGDSMVALIDGHALFAQHGAMPKPERSLTCRLPDDDWAQTILAPLVAAAGYTVADTSASDVDIVIMLDAEMQAQTEQSTDWAGNSGQASNAVIRLRSQPDRETTEQVRAQSIYRYDREGLIKALREAGRGAVA